MTRSPAPTRFSRLLGIGLAVTLLVSGCAASEPAAPSVTPTPSETAAAVTELGSLGDSMSLGVNSCDTRGQCADASWTIGTEAAVDSIASRLESEQGERPGTVSGAKNGGDVQDAVTNAPEVIAESPQLVTVLVGANDACTESLESMTSVDDYRATLEELLGTLSTELPDSTILLMSVPDLYNLWEIGHTNPKAVAVWDSNPGCHSLLKDADSTAPADVERRQTVSDRVDEFNAVIAELCADTTNCVTDGGALHEYTFSADEISTIDYFHPSRTGQAVMAGIAWDALTASQKG